MENLIAIYNNAGIIEQFIFWLTMLGVVVNYLLPVLASNGIFVDWVFNTTNMSTLHQPVKRTATLAIAIGVLAYMFGLYLATLAIIINVMCIPSVSKEVRVANAIARARIEAREE